MKLSKYVLGVVIVVITMLITGCSNPGFTIKKIGDVDKVNDTTLPSTPSNYTAVCINNKVIINWTDPINVDLYAIGMYYSAVDSTAQTSKEILLPPSKKSDRSNSYVISGEFKEGKTYTIYLCSYDTSLNKSSYVSFRMTYKKAVVESGTYNVMYYRHNMYSGNSISSYDFYAQKTLELKKDATFSQIAESYTGFTVSDMLINNKTIMVFYDRNQYSVSFMNDKGKVISTTTYYYGATPSVPADSAVFVRGKNFTGWSPAIATVTSSATYKPVYDLNVTYYTCSFVTDYVDAPAAVQIQLYDSLTRDQLPFLKFENKMVSAWTSNTGSFFVTGDMVFTAIWMDIPSGIVLPAEKKVYTVTDTTSSSALYNYILGTTKDYNANYFYEDYLFLLETGIYTVQWSDGYRNTNSIDIPGNPLDLVIRIAKYTGERDYTSWLYNVDDGNFNIDIESPGVYVFRVGERYNTSGNCAFHIYKR